MLKILYICIVKQIKNMEDNLKPGVSVLLQNDDGEILVVSRKDDLESFGLIGGKMEECDETPEDCAKRETVEETGLLIFDLVLIYHGHEFSDNREVYTYTAKYTGEIHTDEPHVVKWGSIEDLLNGAFSKYNEMILKLLGIL